MRLLHFDQAGMLHLTDFSDTIVPPYGILSHRWGNSEVLYEDVANKSYKEKDGYRKIEFCAEKAAKDQLHYFWIDTCCIDKWNLQELSKSINSMFLWYKNATKCYVFLPDVSVPTATEIAPQAVWEESFRKSAWFTRGWTLQELIAPSSVEFFSSEGQLLGDKQSLVQLLHAVTRLPMKALQKYSSDDFTISERMEWANGRETTEEEDIVYCLLGILNVSMPASYGEGREKAWIRLKAEVNSSAPFIIPFARNDKFIGQESHFADLEATLFEGKQTTRMAILGLGGTGKSQLALEFAYRTKRRNENCSIFWIDASSIDGIHQSYASIARKLKIPGWDDEKTDLKQMMKLYLNKEDAGQSLLIFDNVNDDHSMSAGLSKTGAATLIDCLPQSRLCSVLFTTTNVDTAKRLAPRNIIELQKMASDVARSMLERYLDIEVSITERLEVELLLQELSHLPLAIVQAAAYINTRNTTLHDYRMQLAKQDQRVPKSNCASTEDATQGHNAQNPVAATLLLSTDQILRDNPLAGEYLFFMACIDRKDILLEFLDAPSPFEKDDAIKILNSYNLVTRRPADSALDIHQLVHGTLQLLLRERGILEKWTQTAITRLSRVFPEDKHGNRSKWRRMLPHAKYALSHSPRGQEDIGKLRLEFKCADVLLSDGQYKESAELLMQVVEKEKRILGNEHPDTLISIANLALAYRKQGRWKEAEELEVHLVKIRKRLWGDEHSFTLISVGNLALTYCNQGRLKEAEKLFLQGLEVRERVLGNEHPDTLTNMGNLASTYRYQGRWREAEELEAKVMKTRKIVLGNDHLDTLKSMANLASTYGSQGRWKKAEELEMQVIETRKRILGSEHPDTLTSMANLASTYRNQGRWKKAEELEMQVIETRKRILGSEHPDTLTSMGSLALTCMNQRRWKDAEKLFAQMMETFKRVLGNEHPSTLTNMANLAATYWNQGRWKLAETLEVQVMETRKTTLGDNHPDTLTSMANLAATYKNLDRWEDSEALDEQVMKTRRKKLGDSHPDTLTSMNNLSDTYKHQGRWKEAEAMDVQVMATRRTKLGDSHPSTLISMNNLAVTWMCQGRDAKALELMEECVRLMGHALGTTHPHYISSLGALTSWQRGIAGVRSLTFI